MLCNARTDFTNASLYAEDTVFAHFFGIEALPTEATLRQSLGELPAERSQSALRTLTNCF
jgi:mRNA-degrading endonuclease toxin of MazEF toxin-antitoxin module